MSLTVVCPGCKASFRGKDEWVGKRTKCPKCGGEIVIGAATQKDLPTPAKPEVAPTPVVESAVTFAVDVHAPAAKVTTKAKVASPVQAPSTPTNVPTSTTETASSPHRRLILAGGGVGLLLFAVGGWWAMRDRGDPANAAAAPQPANAAMPAPVAAAGEVDLADVVERLKTGIVLLTLYDEDNVTLGMGTGFLIDEKRHVVTNYHVVQGGVRATAKFSNGAEADAKALVAVDRKRDLAIVTLDSVPAGAKPLSLAPDVSLRQGAKVVAIGHPRGLGYSVTEGIVSALRKTTDLPNDMREFLEAADDQQWIQTSAAISGGNSGGPLLLPDGRVVGINTWVAGGENLGFAGHVRHILDLTKEITPDSELATLRAYNTLVGGLQKASINSEDDFAEYYGEVVKKAEAVDWLPTTLETRELIQQLAGGAAFSRPRGLADEQLDALSKKLAVRTWDFDGNVLPINDFAVEIFEYNPGRVMLFGKVVQTFDETNQCRVKLLGRGYFVDVFEFVDPGKPRKIGDLVAVLGMRPPGLKTHPQRVAAGLVVPVKVNPPKQENYLRQLRDYVHFDFPCLERQVLLTDPKRNFPQMKLAAAAEPQTTYTLEMNRTNQGFDALRLLASTGKTDDDLFFVVSVPGGRIGAWGLASADGMMPTGVDRYVKLDDYRPPNLPLPPQNETYLVHVPGSELKDSKRHMLWFEFRGPGSAEVIVTGLYRASAGARPSSAQLFAALGLPEVDGTATYRRQQVFNLEKFDLPAGDNRPTLTGSPFARFASEAPSAVAASTSPATTTSAPPPPTMPIAPTATPQAPPQPAVAVASLTNTPAPPAAAPTPSPPQEELVPIRPARPRRGGSMSFHINAFRTTHKYAAPPQPLPGGQGAFGPIQLAIRDRHSVDLTLPPLNLQLMFRAKMSGKTITPADHDGAAKDVKLLQGLGVPLLTLSPRVDATDGNLCLGRLEPTADTAGEFHEPLAVFFDGKPLLPDQAERMAAMPCLMAVVLRNTPVEDLAVAKLLSGSCLQTLIVQNVPLGDDALLRAALGDSMNLVMLEYTNLTNAGVEALLDDVSPMQLSLRGNKIDDRCLTGLPANSFISYLDLTDTQVGDTGLDYLRRLDDLDTLSLGRLKLSAAGIRSLAKIKELNDLNLEGVKLDGPMVDALLELKSLTRLTLSGSGLSDADRRRLVQGLPDTMVIGR